MNTICIIHFVLACLLKPIFYLYVPYGSRKRSIFDMTPYDTNPSAFGSFSISLLSKWIQKSIYTLKKQWRHVKSETWLCSVKWLIECGKKKSIVCATDLEQVLFLSMCVSDYTLRTLVWLNATQNCVNHTNIHKYDTIILRVQLIHQIENAIEYIVYKNTKLTGLNTDYAVCLRWKVF
jgi:hypothetical protein